MRDPPRGGQMVRVGDRHGQCIRRVAAVDCNARQQAFDHRMNLRLFRRAGADHGLFDWRGAYSPTDICLKPSVVSSAPRAWASFSVD